MDFHKYCISLYSQECKNVLVLLKVQDCSSEGINIKMLHKDSLYSVPSKNKRNVRLEVQCVLLGVQACTSQPDNMRVCLFRSFQTFLLEYKLVLPE